MEASTWIALTGLAVVVVGHIAVMARWGGSADARLKSLDADLGRLNAKVDNDVHGRKAVASQAERLARIEAQLADIARRLDRQEAA